MPDACHLCSSRLVELLELGPQPLCNRFLGSPADEAPAHPLTLAACSHCALVQNPAPPPPDLLRPRFDWLRYREPDEHLDAVAAAVASLPGVGPGSRVVGLGDYDEPLLERLRALGVGAAEALDWRSELTAGEPLAGTETLQALLTPANLRDVAERTGRADVVVLRYVAEHAHDLRALLTGLRELVNPGGHVVLEVPDCAPALEAGDVTTIWEEHVLYFTALTLERALRSAGLTPLASPPAPAGALVVVAAADGEPAPPAPAGAAEARLAEAFAAAVPPARARWHAYMEEESARCRKVALLGAGHTGIMFVNALGLGEALCALIDDQPEKQGLFAPGSKLPVRPSSHLVEGDVATCLLAVPPEAEERVVGGHDAWVESGGRFGSIFPQSNLYPLETASCA